jgi:hypothetical protein
MTTENLAMLAVGQIIAAGMFSLGVLVGSSLRKESKDDSNEGTTKDKGWHDPVGTSAEGGSRSRRPGGADSVTTAHLPISAPIGRGSVWE